MWKIYSSSAQGIRDFNEGRNNQDAVFGYVDEDVAISIICDGCHGGKNSEVIARLSAPFLVRKASALLKNGFEIQDLPEQLFDCYLDYLIGLVEAQSFVELEEVKDFIYSDLMCTIIGVISYKGQILLFNCGDGSYYLNNAIFLVRSSIKERPTYAAYNLLRFFGIIPMDATEIIDDEGVSTKIPFGFETVTLKESDVSLVGIASDGLNPFPALFDELRVHTKSQVSLNLCMNRIVIIREETIDNVTVSFLIKTGG
jgi:hypothetical protein